MNTPPSGPTPPSTPPGPSARVTIGRRLFTSVRTKPVVSGLLIVAAVIWAVFCVLVAMPPWAGVLLPVLVAGFALVALRVMSRRQQQRSSATRTLATVAAASVVALVVIQLVPYGRDQAQPAVTGEPAWANDQTRALMVRACFGCHSSEVDYPVYASIAPISWMVQSHVDEGRQKVNYSQFATNPDNADETIEVILEGEMPPAYYTRFGLHGEADLSAAELQQLIDGLRATPGMGDGREGDDD